MKKDLVTYKKIQSSFISCDKDIEAILKTLFVSSRPYSDLLKRLLVINNKDCLDMSNQEYQKVIDKMGVQDLIERGYIKLDNKINRGTHEEIKSYILISLDGFGTSKASPYYRDYNINFDIVCYNDAWVLNNYKIRPLAIVGYIDGILNSLTSPQANGTLKPSIKLTGIGSYNFLGCNLHILNEDISMYTLSYRGKHFTEDLEDINKVMEEDGQ